MLAKLDATVRDRIVNAGWTETLRQMLINRPRQVTYKDISEASGIPMPWLQQFALRQIVEPSATRAQTLYMCLTGKDVTLL